MAKEKGSMTLATDEGLGSCRGAEGTFNCAILIARGKLPLATPCGHRRHLTRTESVKARGLVGATDLCGPLEDMHVLAASRNRSTPFVDSHLTEKESVKAVGLVIRTLRFHPSFTRAIDAPQAPETCNSFGLALPAVCTAGLFGVPQAPYPAPCGVVLDSICECQNEHRVIYLCLLYGLALTT